MAKKITGYIKLQVPAGKATPSPPIGPALGQHGVNIPGFISKIRDEDWAGALETIKGDNLLPSVCGRVCPQESQCEAQCVLVKAKMQPVAIGRLERFVGDFAAQRPVEPPKVDKPLGRVAIVGSGPGSSSNCGSPGPCLSAE